MHYTKDVIKKIKLALRTFIFKYNMMPCMARDLLTRKIFLWLIIVFFSCISTSSAIPNPDYLGANNRLQMIRDRYCGAYVVWHTMQHYGSGMQIDIIIKNMQINKKNGSSMADIVSALKRYGLKASAVKLRIDDIDTLGQPYIPYIPSDDKTKPGHFIFCLPIGKSKALVLDGRKEPRIINLSLLKEENYRAGWDGTSILLGDNDRSDFGSISSISKNLTWGIPSIFLLIVLTWISYKHCSNKHLSGRRLPME